MVLPGSSTEPKEELRHISTPAAGLDEASQEPDQAAGAAAPTDGQAVAAPDSGASPRRNLRCPQGFRAPIVPAAPAGNAMANEALTGEAGAGLSGA